MAQIQIQFSFLLPAFIICFMNVAYHITKHYSSKPIDVHILQKVIGVLDWGQVGRDGLHGGLKKTFNTIRDAEIFS